MGNGVGLAAAAAAIVSAVFVWLQVREMQKQTGLQREIAASAAQPYVWADIRLQEVNGWILEFAIGNSGSTVATNVRVQVDPPFVTDLYGDATIEPVLEKLDQGLASIAPGRTISWSLGGSPKLVFTSASRAYKITINCMGPHGPVPESEFIIDLADMREMVAHHAGSLHEIAKGIEKAAKRLADERHE